SPDHSCGPSTCWHLRRRVTEAANTPLTGHPLAPLRRGFWFDWGSESLGTLATPSGSALGLPATFARTEPVERVVSERERRDQSRRHQDPPEDEGCRGASAGEPDPDQHEEGQTDVKRNANRGCLDQLPAPRPPRGQERS